MTHMSKPLFTVVDLFSGAGGLSYGFLQTGRYEIKAAFENNEDARKTYKQNHPNTEIYGDISDIFTEAINSSLGKIDLVIGGPPCQGFSNANRQRNNTICQNNSLIKKYVQAVLQLNPTAYVMENVSMFQSDIHRFYIDKNDESVVRKYEIETTPSDIHLIDSTLLFDGIEALVKDIYEVEKYIWHEERYSLLNIVYKKKESGSKLVKTLAKYCSKLLPLALELTSNRNQNNPIINEEYSAGNAIIEYFTGEHTLKRATDLCVNIGSTIMYQRMLSKVKELYDNQIVVLEFMCSDEQGLVAKVNSMAILDYIESILGLLNGYVMVKGTLSAAEFGVPQKRSRFVMIGVKSSVTDNVTLPSGKYVENSFYTVKDAIGDLENVEALTSINKDRNGVAYSATASVSPLGERLRNSTRLYNHVATASTPGVIERFKALKQGQNFHDLPESLKKTYSDSKRTQNSIYLRLKYDEPSCTVVNVRKSMWIHPVKDRALTIREAARLQSFPDGYIFKGTKDSQYQQVGNAVPPILARAIAEHMCCYLDHSR